MRHGIVGTPLDLAVPFAQQINAACSATNWFPYVVSAAQTNETNGRADAATVVSGDGGHGVMQLTSSYPVNWDEPYANILYAIDNFLKPAETYWSDQLQGDDLIRAMLAEFNAGRGEWHGPHDPRNRGALGGHLDGDVDLYTTNRYGQRGLVTYHKLLAGEAV